MTHQLVLTSTWTFPPSSEVATTRQTDGTAHKLKPRLFHKSAYLQVHSADFHPGVNRAWQVGIPNHPNWLTFARESNLVNDSPRVIIYVNIKLSSFQFSLCKDIINHKNILLVSFFNNNNNFWIMNIYSDSFHSTLKYLKNSEVNIQNFLIMTDDFNIRDSILELFFPHHSSISDNLIIIADLFNLDLSVSTNPIPTRYSDTVGELNSVIDLMFLWSGLTKLKNHLIYLNWHLTSNHTPFTVSIPIMENDVNSSKFSIVKNSEKEYSLRISHPLLRILTSLIYLILTNLKTWSTHSLWILNVHGIRIQS